MSPPDGSDLAAGLGSVLSVEIGEDGGVTLKTPSVKKVRDGGKGFKRNLADEFDFGGVAEDLLEGIESDIRSRDGMVQQYADGMKLLGLEVEDERGGQQSRKGRSKVGHPLLLTAIVDAQSSASGELLPSNGPCKVSTRNGSSAQEDDLAEALEEDLNWYLTSGAREYYPDMDRGIFGLMYSGNLFKDVYEHPIRRRPVGECISTNDMIVSEDATDLDTAVRVTRRHQDVTRNEVKRMQYAGAWIDVELGMPMMSVDPAQAAMDRVQGLRRIGLRPQDQMHTIYQCTSDLILEDYGITDHQAPSDLPVSYRVTMDKDSRKVLAAYRQWRHDDDMFQRRQRYVHYGMVPGFGFLCLGYLHLLGNQTKALRAIWRLLIDAGMFSNFPGGVKVKGVRTSTNEINPGPGEWPDIDIGGMDDIRKALMAMPYKGPDAVFIQLAELVGKESSSIAGVAKLPVGDSRVDIPVGTMLAMVEQATKTDSAVHKRLWRSQSRELELFKELFADNPEALWKLNPNPKRQWMVREEIMNMNLVPAADPNVPSHIHRIMQNTAMVTVAGQNPDIYDRKMVHERAWRSMGVQDTDEFLHDPTPPPDAGGAAADPSKMAKVQVDQQRVVQAGQDAQRKAAQEVANLQQKHATDLLEQQGKAADRLSKERIEGIREQTERMRLAVETTRAHRQMAHDVESARQDRSVEAHSVILEHARHGAQLAHDAAKGEASRKAQSDMAKVTRSRARTTGKESE